DLELAGIVHRLTVNPGDGVASLQARLRTGRIRFNLRDQGAFGLLHVEEARVLRGHIVDSDPDVAVADFAVLDQVVHGWADDLSWNGKACAGKRSGARNQKGVDAYNFTVRINQRSAGVTGIDGRIGLNELAALAAVAVGIRTVQRANASARHRETQADR